MATATYPNKAIGALRAVRGYWEGVLRTRRSEIRRAPNNQHLRASERRIVEHIQGIDRIIRKIKEGGQ